MVSSILCLTISNYLYLYVMLRRSWVLRPEMMALLDLGLILKRQSKMVTSLIIMALYHPMRDLLATLDLLLTVL